jgi:hypothetical protein
MRVPAEAEQLGVYQGFDLYYQFVSSTAFSARSVACGYATAKGASAIEFVQITVVRHGAADELTKVEIERRLAVDVISRVKTRIADRSFERGEVYTIELDAASMERPK